MELGTTGSKPDRTFCQKTLPHPWNSTHTLDISDSVNYLLTKISKNIEFVKYTFIIRKSQEEIEYSNKNFFRDAQLSLCGEQ